MKLFFIIIYVMHHLITISEGYAANNQKHVKRMIPPMYADFAVADERFGESRMGRRDIGGDMGGGRECNSCNSNFNPGASTNPKQKGANIALKAAQEAKAASDAQQEAGQAASHQVKMQLAEKAMQAAKAAEAALAGKQQLVEQLEQEVHEAEQVLQEQSSSLQGAQQNVEAAVQAYQQAQTQLKTLSNAVRVAQSNVGNSELAAKGAQQELAEKNQLMEAAKFRIDQLIRQLNAARSDFVSTKQAAYKAACAAHEAQVNAQRSRRHLLKHAYLTPQQRQQLLAQRQRRDRLTQSLND